MAILAPLLAAIAGGGGAAAGGAGAAGAGAGATGAGGGLGSLMSGGVGVGSASGGSLAPIAGLSVGGGGGATPGIMQLLMQSQGSKGGAFGGGDPSQGWNPMPQLGPSTAAPSGGAPQMSPLTMRLLQQYMQQLMPQGGGFQWPTQ